MDIMLSKTARRLTKLAKAAGATLEVTPSKGGVTGPGNEAQWMVNGALQPDAAQARYILKSLLTPAKKEKK